MISCFVRNHYITEATIRIALRINLDLQRLIQVELTFSSLIVDFC